MEWCSVTIHTRFDFQTSACWVTDWSQWWATHTKTADKCTKIGWVHTDFRHAYKGYGHECVANDSWFEFYTSFTVPLSVRFLLLQIINWLHVFFSPLLAFIHMWVFRPLYLTYIVHLETASFDCFQNIWSSFYCIYIIIINCNIYFINALTCENL